MPFLIRLIKTTCSAGLVPGNGSVEAYLADNVLKEIAMDASTPSGYANSFTNELGSIYQPDDYLTVTSLDAYVLFSSNPFPFSPPSLFESIVVH